jgi:hypothetical protein
MQADPSVRLEKGGSGIMTARMLILDDNNHVVEAESITDWLEWYHNGGSERRTLAHTHFAKGLCLSTVFIMVRLHQGCFETATFSNGCRKQLGHPNVLAMYDTHQDALTGHARLAKELENDHGPAEA